MITKSNLKEVLKSIDYQDQGNYYIKQYPEFDCSITVDFENEKINYPEDKGFMVYKRTTCNFSEPENFVVLECVTRLMDKGYRPEHIEIEKTWSLGHDQKSGRADILVKESSGRTLFIIECKTYGKEYDKALKDTLNDGAQLFSYWQQEKYCRWLILYTSTLALDNIEYKSCAINCTDDKNLIELANKDSSILLYKNAYTVPELYSVWKDTYEKRLLGDILFRDDSIAYQVGVKPLRKIDLVDFSEKDKVVNKFEEILRHNNVSDKENAFNRLVALFICKLVDEIQKTDSDIVDFQYKVGTDTYESLQDRLQRLHKEGMEKFMREDIFYIPEDYAKRTIQQYTGVNRQELIKELDKTLRILKFYTNNDFAFKDVHNEELFLQNGKILVEVVKLFENYRIIGSNNLQMLGDLFEQLLNKGFKQNEGQFFTPVPITRFIWDSLPLESIIREDEKVNVPKVIDYACGAGHFLTEGYEAINDVFMYIDPSENINSSWARDFIYGIEKDYRLARVSKISLFMHGAGEGNVVFGDGLENYKEKGIIPGTFDILVANPPYSVSAFKPHLNIKNNYFEILDKISNTGSEIETLFVERISQLLKPKAVAAVILPSSILNKENESFIAARESILKNFKIRTIVSLSSKTFGATGTNTVVLFLEKFDEPPKKIDLIKDSVDSILAGKPLQNWEDESIFKNYLKTIGVKREDYINFIERKINYYDYENKYFKNYATEFINLTSVKTKMKQRSFTKLNKSEQDIILNKLFYDYTFKIEREKIKYFALIYNERTLIINAPSDNKGQEEFLGYKWSNRKGQEGIQLLNTGGKLYKDDDRRDENTLASLIRKSFYEEEFSIDNLEEYYYYLNTKDMLDFRSAQFNKGIVIQNKNLKNEYQGSFPIDNLGNITKYVTEKVMYEEINPDYYVTTDNMLKDKRGVALYNNIPNVNKIIQYYVNDILVSNIRPYLKKIWLADHQGGCSNDILVFRVLDTDRILPEYLYEIMKDDAFFDFMMSTAKGIKMPRGDKEKISDYLVPIPSIQQQRIIINEFKKADNKINDEQKLLEQYDEDIKSKFVEMFEGKKFIITTLGECCLINPDTDFKNIYEEISYVPMSNVGEHGELILDIKPVSEINKGYTKFAENDVLFAKITPCMENGKGAIVKGLLNKRGIGSTEFHIIRPIEHISNSYWIYYLTSMNNFRENAQKAMTGASGHRRVPEKFLTDYAVNLPPKELQDEFEVYVEEIDKLKFVHKIIYL